MHDRRLVDAGVIHGPEQRLIRSRPLARPGGLGAAKGGQRITLGIRRDDVRMYIDDRHVRSLAFTEDFLLFLPLHRRASRILRFEPVRRAPILLAWANTVGPRVHGRAKSLEGFFFFANRHLVALATFHNPHFLMEPGSGLSHYCSGQLNGPHMGGDRVRFS